MWNQIMRHGGKLYFEELRSIESESVTNKANDNSIVIARRILETLNVFSRYFASRQHDVENTLETESVAGKFDALSLKREIGSIEGSAIHSVTVVSPGWWF